MQISTCENMTEFVRKYPRPKVTFESLKYLTAAKRIYQKSENE